MFNVVINIGNCIYHGSDGHTLYMLNFEHIIDTD